MKMQILRKRKYAIATIKSWNIEEGRRFISKNSDLRILLITNKKKLNYRKIKSLSPKYMFFPHWSWKIPKKIYENYECIVFHMTDLPFGRGGSPLQNLIQRGIYNTKISAVKVAEKIDAGPIYLKRNLDLKGSATEIFKRAAKIIYEDMIPYIIRKQPIPIPQKGKIQEFKRRNYSQSNIANLANKRKVYDYIRMLDAEGYPPAFVETPTLRIEFSTAKIKNDYVLANAKISTKVKNEF